MLKVITSDSELEQVAIKGFACRFTQAGHKLNPYRWIERNLDMPLVRESLARIINVDLECINAIIDSVCTGITSEFYKALYSKRLDELKRISSSPASRTSLFL